MALQGLGHSHGVHGAPRPHAVPRGTPGMGDTGFQQPGALRDDHFTGGSGSLLGGGVVCQYVGFLLRTHGRLITMFLIKCVY